MAQVVLRSLTKRFGEVVAVDGVELDIRGGEFFSLLGPSGCGKTTTLRLIAGLEEPTAGRILIGGEDVTDRPAHQRGVGMVFQNYALFPHLNVQGNVAYGLKARHAPRREMRQRVEAALAQVDLAGYDGRRISALSGGQQQRVAVARATAPQPSLLLLDEPLSNLDARLRVETRAMLRELQQELGSTAVYVTHDQEEALALSDRLAVMHQGRVQQVGTPVEVYDQPANRFVATFIGRANLVEVTVLSRDGDRCRVRLPGGEECSARAGASSVERGLATLCLRPEALLLGEGDIPATVTAATFNGPWLDYELAVYGDAWQVVEPNRGQQPRSPGDRTTLSIASGAAVLVP